MLWSTPFDEPFLGVRCYRLEPPIAPSDLSALSVARAEGELFASAKIDASDLETGCRLKCLGFRKICTQVLLRVGLEGPPAAAEAARITDRIELGPIDVRAHAAQLETGRIRQDPLIATETAIDFYAAWVRNCTSGGKRVASIGRNFLTFEDTAGVRSIDLLSVIDKRAGIATRLLSTIVEDARRNGLREVKVLTDRDNIAARHAYAAVGFVPKHLLAIFHLLSRRA